MHCPASVDEIILPPPVPMLINYLVENSKQTQIVTLLFRKPLIHCFLIKYWYAQLSCVVIQK